MGILNGNKRSYFSTGKEQISVDHVKGFNWKLIQQKFCHHCNKRKQICNEFYPMINYYIMTTRIEFHTYLCIILFNLSLIKLSYK